MNTLRTIGITFLVALVVAVGVSYFVTKSINGVGDRLVEALKTSSVGAFSGNQLNQELYTESSIYTIASGTVGIGTTTNVSLPSNQGFLILQGYSATPTIALFATSTNPNKVNQETYGGCIEFASATNTAQFYRLYVGDPGDGLGLQSIAGASGLIFEGGRCQ